MAVKIQSKQLVLSILTVFLLALSPQQGNTFQTTPTIQAELITELNKGDVYGFLWSTPDRLVARGSFGFRQFDRVSGQITELPLDQNDGILTFSPDGSLLAKLKYSSSSSRSFEVWDVSSGELLFSTPIDRAERILFTPSGREILIDATGEKTLYWKTEELVQGNAEPIILQEKQGYLIGISSYDITDGILVATGDGTGKINIWEVQDVMQLRDRPPTFVLANHQNAVTSIAFSPDGRRLISSSFLTSHGERRLDLREWDIPARAQRNQLTLDADTVLLCPDGEHFLLTPHRQEARLWSLPKREPVATITGLISYPSCSSDGKLMAYLGRDNAIHVYDLTNFSDQVIDTDYNWNGVQIIFNAHSDLALIQYYSPSHQDSILRFKLWDLEARKTLAEGEDVPAVFSPDGLLLAVGDQNGTVHLLDAYTGLENRLFRKSASAVHSLVFHPNGNHLAIGYSDGIIQLLNVHDGHIREVFTGMEGSVIKLQFSPSGKFLVSATESFFLPYIQLWNLEAPTNLILEVVGSELIWRINEIVFSPDETILAIGGFKMTGAATTGIVQLYHTQTGQHLAALGRSWSIAELPPGIDPRTYRVPHAHHYSVFDIGFFRDGTVLASASGDVLRVWNIPIAALYRVGVDILGTENLDELLYTFRLPGGGRPGDASRIDIGNMVFNPSLTQLAFGDLEGKIHLLEFSSTGQLEEHILDTQQDELIQEIAFTPDGQILIAASEGDFQVWDMETLTQITDIPEALAATVDCNRISFSPDGQYMGLTSCYWQNNGNSVQIWRLQSD